MFNDSLENNKNEEKQVNNESVKDETDKKEHIEESDEAVFEAQTSEETEESTEDLFYKETDISQPHEWYPEARKIDRIIYFHMGPTNSGKTYEAINALK